MAEGDFSDDNLLQVVIQFNEADELFLMEFWPQYVINATIIDRDIRRALPQIRIPRRFTAVNAGFFVDLLRRSLNQLAGYPLTPGPYHNPLLYMLAWNADYWSIAVYASGEALEIAFFPVYINTPSMSESSTDDEQPGPSNLVSNSEARAGAPSTSESSTDDEQPGPSNLVNNIEHRVGGSRTSADQSSGSQVKTRQGFKRKREHGRSESRQQKKRRLDHNPNSLTMFIDNSPEAHWETHMSRSSTDDEQPGPSNLVNSSKARAGGSRTPDRSERRERKRWRPDHWSDSDTSSDSLSSGFASPAILDNSGELSRAPSDQSSDSQDEMKRGVKRKTSSRSESREDTKNRLDHHSGSDSNDDQADPSVRDNNEARAGGFRTPSDQSSGSQMETRQGLKRKRKTSDRKESREQKPRR